MGHIFGKRQTTSADCGDDYDCSGYDSWGYSTTATAIKWAVVGVILLIILLWFVGGYYHAQRRIRKGLRPLPYHMWLLPASQRTQFVAQPQFAFDQHRYGQGEGYPMQVYPPPAYNTGHAPPPVYQPPEGRSKVNPAQDWAVPPPGPPPGYANTGESSNAMHDVHLH